MKTNQRTSLIINYDKEAALYMEVGERIKALRVMRGYTQLELSKQIRLSRSSISNVEIGVHKLLLHTIYEISQVLDIEIYDLLPPTYKIIK